MCEPDKQVIVSFKGGSADDTHQVITGRSGRKGIILRFNDASLECTGRSSRRQLSCYLPPGDYKAAKDVAQDPNRSLQVHGSTSGTDVADAAWSPA